MENNTNISPTPNMQISPDNMQVSKKGNSSMWIVVIVLIVIVLIAGVYLYIRNQSNSGIPTNTPATTSSESSLNSLSSELNVADTTGDNTDLNQLDRDLQNL